MGRHSFLAVAVVTFASTVLVMQPVALHAADLPPHDYSILITVVVWLVWTFNRYTNVVCLFLRQRRQVCADLFQVQAGHFFIEDLRQNVHFVIVFICMFIKLDLGHNLVSE